MKREVSATLIGDSFAWAQRARARENASLHSPGCPWRAKITALSFEIDLCTIDTNLCPDFVEASTVGGSETCGQSQLLMHIDEDAAGRWQELPRRQFVLMKCHGWISMNRKR
jgi:hypothetical protein